MNLSSPRFTKWLSRLNLLYPFSAILREWVDPQTIGVLPSSSPAESLYSDTYPDIVTDLFVPPNPLLLYLRLTPTH